LLPGSQAQERFGLFRRHFFLLSALLVLVVMVLAGGVKLLAPKAGPGGGAAAGGPGGAGAPGGPGGGRGGRGGPPAQVSVAVVQSHQFADQLEVLGVAKGRQSVTLTAATTQLVDKVRFVDGQMVPRGAVLVELKSTEQDAGLAQAEARLTQARQEFGRWTALSDKGFASKSSVDQYRAAFLSAQADVNVAKARQGDRVIRAPFAGVVGLSDVTPGALVNPGAPIVTLDDLSSIRVDFQVPERYLPQISEGQAIRATVDAYAGEVIHGRIDKLDTRIDERTRALTARAVFPNPNQRLKPGMMVRVGISRGARQGVGAPESAVSVQGDSAFVYVLTQNGPRTTAEQRPVLTGLRQDGFVEITEGVKPGDRLVADGLNKIQPGQPVSILGQKPRTGASGRPPA
jgi:membrane fusion protein (multidrug efflux system)